MTRRLSKIQESDGSKIGLSTIVSSQNGENNKNTISEDTNIFMQSIDEKLKLAYDRSNVDAK